MKNKFYGLDHLRALAIILVFFFHYFIVCDGQPKWLPNIASFGWTGVDLFFVLSGFLISSQLFEQIKQGQQVSFKHFFLKRFLRIIPAFLVTVAIYFYFPFFREKEALPPIWKFFTFTQNFGLDVKNYGTFSHCWSLCVEEHFYFLFPIILICLQKFNLFSKSYWLIIGLFIVGFTVRVYSFEKLYLPKLNDENFWLYWYKYIYYPTYNRIDGLLIGVSIAGLYVFSPNMWGKISKYGNLLFITGLFIMTAAYFICEDQQTLNASTLGFPIIAIGFGFMVLSATCPTSFLYKWNSKVTTLIATLSYAIYLTHKGVIHTTHFVLKSFKIDNNVMLLICILNCIGFAFLLHLIIEKPFIKLRNKIVSH